MAVKLYLMNHSYVHYKYDLTSTLSSFVKLPVSMIRQGDPCLKVPSFMI